MLVTDSAGAGVSSCLFSQCGLLHVECAGVGDVPALCVQHAHARKALLAVLTCCQIVLQIGKATTKAGSVLAQVAVHGGREVSCATAPSRDIGTTLL